MLHFKSHIILFSILLLFAGVACEALDAQDDDKQEHKDKGKSAYDAIASKVGTVDGVTKNLTNPLTAGDQFSTLDGTRTYTQQISCPSSANYLELFFGLNGSGDLSPVRIRQDSNFDGVYDHGYSVPYLVSGVCSNGIISCEAGTFNGCRYFLWDANSGRVDLSETTHLNDLAGCYCVNSSCGNNLGFNNRNAILDELAGGIAGALMSEEPRYAISKVEKQDFIITLAGQDTRNCRDDDYEDQHTFFEDPSSLSAAAFSSASTDPVSNLVQNISVGANTGLVTNNCVVERQVTLDEIVSTDVVSLVTATAPYRVVPITDNPNAFAFEFGDNTDNGIDVSGGCNLIHHQLVYNIGEFEKLNEARFNLGFYEDQIAIRVNGDLIFGTDGFDGLSDPADCQINDQSSVTINTHFLDNLQPGTNTIDFYIAVKDRGSGQITGHFLYDTECDLVEDIRSTCDAYANDDRCLLFEETVDGVNTWHNGGRTGLTPLVQTRTLYGAQCEQTFSFPWFVRNRTYQCETEGDSARNFDFTRQSHIYGNSTNEEFADRLEINGDVVLSTGNMSIDADFGISDCQQMCKTRSLVTDTEVASSGVVGSILRNPSATGEFNYHQCAGGTCPIGPGEQLVTDCGCLNEFPQALTIMQTFRLAGQDLLCTSGVKQSLQ